MDLRKKVLLRKEGPLADVSFNSSIASIYESAGEDSDSDSLYYSFSNTDFNDSQNRDNMLSDLPSSENQNNANDSDKHELSNENDGDDTIIMMESDITVENIEIKGVKMTPAPVLIERESDKENFNVKDIKTTTAGVMKANEPVVENVEKLQELKKPDEIKKPQVEQRVPLGMLKIPLERDQLDAVEAPESMDIDTSFEVGQVNQQQQQQQQHDLAVQTPIPAVQIIIEDPNQNIINPFLVGSESPVVTSDLFASTSSSAQLKSAKKSASKIPTRSHFYSPLQRASIDRKTKITIKPSAEAKVRRTIYQPRSADALTKTQVTKPTVAKPLPAPKLRRSPVSVGSSSSSTVKSTKPVNAVKPSVAKPKPPINKAKIVSAFKCTYPGCNREFRSGLAYQDHLKSHKSSSSSAVSISSSSSLATTSTSTSLSSFKCKWCDKTFGLSNALTNHLIEACTKIPFAERRKLIGEQDKIKPVNNKRKSMFMAPEPVVRKRSPRRQTINTRKSGVVTPKKSMKCHVDGCGQVFTDVLAFANHMVSHKYDGVLSAPSSSSATTAAVKQA